MCIKTSERFRMRSPVLVLKSGFSASFQVPLINQLFAKIVGRKFYSYVYKHCYFAIIFSGYGMSKFYQLSGRVKRAYANRDGS